MPKCKWCKEDYTKNHDKRYEHKFNESKYDMIVRICDKLDKLKCGKDLVLRLRVINEEI